MDKKIEIVIPEEVLEKMAIITGYALSDFFEEKGNSGHLLACGMVALYTKQGVETGYKESFREIKHKTDIQLPFPVKEDE